MAGGGGIKVTSSEKFSSFLTFFVWGKCCLLQCYNVNLLLLVWLHDLLSLLRTIDLYHQAAMFNKVYHIFKGYNNILKYVCKIFDNALPYTGILHVQCMFD